jgi:4'-phosphopantetheinyl transferase
VIGEGTPVRSPLPDDEVHVWRARVEVAESRLREVRELLSNEERRRADGYRAAADRARFVVARGLLRALAAGYLEAEPGRLRFRPGPHGKPELDGSPGAAALRFNVSHSGALALLAFARGREVGVDVERIRTDLPLDLIAGRFFSQSERALLGTLAARESGVGAGSVAVEAGDDRQAAFFALWTAKEACLKAGGTGFAISPETLTRLGTRRTRLVAVDDRDEESTWCLRLLDAGPGYAAALAAAGHDWRLRCFEWP